MLIDRLAGFQSTGNEIDAQQALVLLIGLSADEARNLDARCAASRVGLARGVRDLRDRDSNRVNASHDPLVIRPHLPHDVWHQVGCRSSSNSPIWGTDQIACTSTISYDAAIVSVIQSNGGERSVRFAIISDPHALAGDQFRHETHARSETADDPTRNPFAAVRRLIEESQNSSNGEGDALTANALLCPGDLAHRRNEDGLKYAWEELNVIAGLLGAKRIVATAGNHDVTRHEELPPNAQSGAWVEALRHLTPHFPSLHEEEASDYFLDDFVIAEDEHWRVLTLNSCANHTMPGQSWRGKIDDSTLKLIAKKMAQDRKPINILMCHHHPVEWRHLTSSDTGYMQNGERLVRTLEHDDPAGWLLLHGHRHVPALGYAGETSSGLVRLSAGSLGASLPFEDRLGVLNQFYMLDFQLDELAELDLRGAGHFRAWDWHPETGLVEANPAADLPPRGGFGFRLDAYKLARLCREAAKRLSVRSVTWSDLVEDDRRWSYVAPSDLRMLRLVLERDRALVEPAEGGSNIQRVSFLER